MPKKEKRLLTKTRGFTLIELIIVIAIIMVVSSMGYITVNSALKDSHVATGYNQVLMALRRGRETAISERRVYKVAVFTPGSQCDTLTKTTGFACVVVTKASTDQIVFTGLIPKDVAFYSDTHLPNTTTMAPDHLVTGAALAPICFDIQVSTSCPNEVYFQPDGSARDINGFINNGIVYIARPNEINSTRAITVLGITGRIRGWQVAQSGSNYYWVQR